MAIETISADFLQCSFPVFYLFFIYSSSQQQWRGENQLESDNDWNGWLFNARKIWLHKHWIDAATLNFHRNQGRYATTILQLRHRETVLGECEEVKTNEKKNNEYVTWEQYTTPSEEEKKISMMYKSTVASVWSCRFVKCPYDNGLHWPFACSFTHSCSRFFFIQI